MVRALAERFPKWRPLARRFQARASQWFESATYARKWLVLGALIGVIAGLGAYIFFEALQAATHLLLGALAGYEVPTPVGEGSHIASGHYSRPWSIPLVACGGALLGAILVFTIAPDAEGHGTDAAIDAVHHNPRGIRFRTVLIKIVASALTIGSGGSGGREGPTGQISAGFGSLLARMFDLTPADARIAVASGIGSGIGSIFGAPLGGSILATEILYRDDFEVEALLPSFIASIVGYAIFGSIKGFSPLFGYVDDYRLGSASQLVWFGLIGIVGGLIGLLYAKGFYGFASAFSRLPVPRWIRPAIGGLVVGLIALAIPEVLGTGYGWIQQGLGSQLLHIPLWIVLILPFARIASTGLSIGSGGSGGIFGPGMVIGAFTGAAVWRLLEPVVPSLGKDPAPYVIVGMMACFGSISRAPLAVMLMVAEMTGTLTLIVPAMVAVGLASLIVRRTDDTIYRSQLRSRSESPAHRILAGLPLLSSATASQAMAPPRCMLNDSDTSDYAQREMENCGVTAAAVVDPDGRYVGVVTSAELQRTSKDLAGDHLLREVADRSYSPIHQTVHLDVVLDTVTSTPQTWAAVIDGQRRVVGTISTSDIVRSYRRTMLDSIRRASELGGATGISDVVVGDNSSMAGMSIRSAGIPHGVLITSIERGREIIQPTGETFICEGDRMMVLGAQRDLVRIKHLASGDS